MPTGRAEDIVIVGGGPAGLSTALFLAHVRPSWRERMVVLEKERYPRDKFCAGGLGARADRLLASIGAAAEVPSVPVSGMAVTLAGGTVVQRGSGAIGRVVRRIELDQALAERVRARGVRVLEGTRVTGLSLGGAGATVETSSSGSLRAEVVVGADGVGSVVRRALGLPFGGLKAQVAELDTEPVAGDRARDLLCFDASDRGLVGYAWDFPTLVGGEALVCRGIYALETPGGPKLDLVESLRLRLARMGLDLSRYRLKRMAERGFEPHRAYAAPRVLLVGEAAGIDALTGEGIAQAISYGAHAARYLADKLERGETDFADWRARLDRSPLGIDLKIRRAMLGLCFGRLRPVAEAALHAAPGALGLIGTLFGGGVRKDRWMGLFGSEART